MRATERSAEVKLMALQQEPRYAGSDFSDGRFRGTTCPRVVVVLKNALFRFLLRDVLISRLPEYDVLAAAEAKEVPTSAEGENRLVVLGAEATVGDDLRLLWPIPVLLFSQEDDAALVDVALAYKCRGFFHTNASVDLAIATVQLILAGGTHFPHLTHETVDLVSRSEAKESSAANFFNGATRKPRFAAETGAQHDKLGLTFREHQVLRELCLGHPNKIIARNLNITEKTAKMHVRRILAELQAKNRTEAVILFRAKSID